MTNYKNHRDEPYFTLVKCGKKTVEARIKKGKYGKIKPGDFIVVLKRDSEESIKVRVLGVRNYNNFKEMFEKEDYKKIIPDAKNIEEALKEPFRFYTKEMEKKYGVVAIEVKLLN